MSARRIIDGRYELTSPLGSSRMSEVWAGYDVRLDRPIAVKLVRPPHEGDPSLLRRFVREARATARVEHPGVPAVFDVGADGDELYLVMQLIPGLPLRDVIAEHPLLEVTWALAAAAQVAAALAAAHDCGLVHRDLKPGNVMVSPDGTVTVIDFGLAAIMDPAATRLTGGGIGHLGTPAYMSPEQARGGRAGPRADLYALGCVLYEMLVGEPPFPSDDPLVVIRQHLDEQPPPVRRARPDVPAAVDELVTSLLAKDPDGRPPDAAAVHDALRVMVDVDGYRPGPDLADVTAPYRRPLVMARRAAGALERRPNRVGQQQVPDLAGAQQRAVELIEDERFAAAADLLSAALARAALTAGADHRGVLEARLDLAEVLLLGEEYEAARHEYDAVARRLAAADGPDDEVVLHCRFQAAVCRAALGETAAAIRQLEQLASDQERAFPGADPRVLRTRQQLVMLYSQAGETATATSALDALITDASATLEPTDPMLNELNELRKRLSRLADPE